MTELTGERAATGRLARASGVMAAGTLVSRLLGFVRNLVLAAGIGTALVGDTFNLANTVPTIIYILVAGGVLNAVFVPQLVRAMNDGAHGDGGQAYADRLLTLSGLVLAAITLLATIGAPIVVRVYAGGSLSSGDLALGTTFAYWCLPQVFFYGVYTMLGQVLNARGSFGPMMWAPVVNNVVSIATGVLFIAVASARPADTASVSGAEAALLGAGTTLGVVSQAAVLLPVLRRTGFRYRPRFDFRGSGLGHAGRLAVWTLLFVLANQVGYLVVVKLATDTAKAAAGTLGYGVGFTPYVNAHLVFQLPHAIVAVSVVTALLPRMSAAAAEGRLAGVRSDISRGLRLTAVALVPAAAAFVALGPELGTLMYHRGLTPLAGARYVGLVLAAFGPGVVTFSAHYLALRGFYALEDTRTPFFITVALTAVNVALVVTAHALLPVRWVVVGMAGSYSFAYAVGLVLSLTLLRRRIGGLDGARVLRTYVRLGLAAGLAGLLAYAVAAAATAVLGTGDVGALVAVLAGGGLLGVLYVVLARAMRVDELTGLLSMVRARSRR